jgi:hypothetical protein
MIIAAAGGDNHVRAWDMDGIGEVRVERPRSIRVIENPR